MEEDMKIIPSFQNRYLTESKKVLYPKIEVFLEILTTVPISVVIEQNRVQFHTGSNFSCVL